MSQDTLFSRAFSVPVRIGEGLVPSDMGTVYTFDLCHVLLFRVQLLVYALPAGSHSPELFWSLDTEISELGHYPLIDVISHSEVFSH